MSPLADFHPAVARWFGRAFAAPTDAQRAAWPQIRAGRHTLVAAPTGSGQDADRVPRRARRPGAAGPASRRAARRDGGRLRLAAEGAVERHPDQPRGAARRDPRRARALGLPDVEIRTAVRTGDTPGHERQRALRKPPHILVTTPESLYVLLGSPRSRRDARNGARGDRRRDPRRRREQARQPPRALARAARRADRSARRSLGAPHRLARIGLRRRRSRSTRSRASWSAPARRRTASPTARSSTSATPRSATSRSSCRRRRSRR